MNQYETKKVCYWTGSLQLEKESRHTKQPHLLARKPVHVKYSKKVTVHW